MGNEHHTGTESHSQVCVIGLGYVGLPTALLVASQGIAVQGVDVDQARVAALQRGEAAGSEAGLNDLLRAALQNGTFVPALTPCQAEVFVIAVQTPVTADKRPDLSYVETVARDIVPHLSKDTLVVLESTVPVGTTKEVLCPILAESGLDIGAEVLVAYCPERALPGNLLTELLHNPRLAGGINELSAKQAADFYRSFVRGPVLATDCGTAEMAKLMENTFRDVNIALANEMAKLAEAHGVDFWAARELANRHPRVDIHEAGPGVGGHCVPLDPYLLIDRHWELAPLIRQARETNDSMPEHVIRLLEEVGRVGPPGPVAVLGASYKRGIDDTRESPSARLIEILQARGYDVRVTDPKATSFRYPLQGFEAAVSDAAALILAVDHDEYARMEPGEMRRLSAARLVVDARNCLDSRDWTDGGFEVVTLGRRESDQCEF